MPLTDKQKQVINHGKGNILVSASAGSGKTHTMVERAIRLITEENVNVNEILCVTFTEKAAFEMKERLRKALTLKIEINESDYLKAQLNEIATADISTLHAFCARLIRTYFFTAGVSPDFNILEEGEATVFKNKSIEKVFKNLYDQGESWFYTLVDRLAVSRADKKLKELVLLAYSFCNSEAEPEKLMQASLDNYTKEKFLLLTKQYKNRFNKRAERLKALAQDSLDFFTGANFDKGVIYAEQLLLDIDAMIYSEDIYSLKKFEDYKLSANFGRIKDEIVKEQKNRVIAVKDSVIKLVNKFVKCVGNSFEEDFNSLEKTREHTEWFLRVLNQFSNEYANSKFEENALDFNDLEHFALKILQDEQVLTTVKNKYKYIFVDEYQDTNGVQESIINKIQTDNVFMVGDVKQSIYGFRGCRSEFFTRKEKDMSNNGQAVVHLNENFRSAKKLIDLVNQIFSYCMDEDIYEEKYAGVSELIYGGTFSYDALGRTKVHYIKREEQKENEETPRIYDILKEKPKTEINHITYTACLISKIINEELQQQVYDAKKKQFRRINYGDIVLLTRNKDNDYVRQIINTLVHMGVPIATDTSVNILDYAEIKMLVNVLKLIDCFSQDVALVSTLKSPIVNVTDEELMEISLAFKNDKKKGHFYQAYEYYVKNYNTKLKEKLDKFESYFKGIRELADFVGAHDILEKIINDNNFRGYLLATTAGVEKIARLNRFLSASMVADKKLTVREFLNKIEVSPKSFALSVFANENTVKAMTVHASKGLEFPVVIVCGLERQFNTEGDYEEVLFDRECGFATKYYNDVTRTKEETIIRSMIRDKIQVERVKEEARLFYVATTRAEYSLHLIFSANDDKRKDFFMGANSFLDFIPSHIPCEKYQESEFFLYKKGTEPRKVLIGNGDSLIVERMRENFSKIYNHKDDTRLPLKVSVTKAVKEIKEKFYPTYVLFDGETTDNERGNIAHKFLEHYDFNSSFDVYSQAQRMIEDEIISKEDFAKINLDRISKALQSKVFKTLSGAKLYREKSFLAQIPSSILLGVNSLETVLVQGIIDLFAVKENKVHIIDYKYSALDARSLKERYEKQLDLYAYAIETSLGLKVESKTLVNLFIGDTVVL